MFCVFVFKHICHVMNKSYFCPLGLSLLCNYSYITNIIMCLWEFYSVLKQIETMKEKNRCCSNAHENDSFKVPPTKNKRKLMKVILFRTASQHFMGMG